MERVEYKRILVFVPNWVGDAVMATPAIAALRRRFPGAKIVALARPYVSGVLSGLADLDEIRGLSSLNSGGSVVSLVSDARALRGEGYDLAVLFTNSFRTAGFALAAGVKARLGYGRDGRSFLLTRRVRPVMKEGDFAPRPMIDYYLELVAVVGADISDRKMKLAVDDAETASATEALSRHGFDGGRPLALVNPGAAFGSAKCWPVENFATLADELSAKGYAVMVITSPRDRAIGEAVERLAKGVKPMIESDITLGTMKGIVARSAVLVTNDSGPRHIGAALGAPVVTIMGPTDPRWSATDYEREILLMKDVECAPCMLRTCPKDHRCMTLIEPGEVAAAVEEAVATWGRESAATQI